MPSYAEMQEVSLACVFSEVLKVWLSPDEMREVIARNRAEPNPSICHSHDFCDANMAMLEAWEPAIGPDIDVHSDEGIALWNAAWSRAKRNDFQMVDREPWAED